MQELHSRPELMELQLLSSDAAAKSYLLSHERVSKYIASLIKVRGRV